MSHHTLYGTPLSLYTGKARSYLIKLGLPYRELTPTTVHYSHYVEPRAKMRMMPTLETADGVVIRDGAAIIEYFESQGGHPSSPRTARQRILSRLIDVIGMEGLLRPAMHYRWNFPEQNEAFLRHHFATVVPPLLDQAKAAAAGMDRMRQAARSFGVVPETFAGIESRYLEFLERLDRHFAKWPYLFGGRPSIGDFSLIAPMYGHLGRDPKPLSILQSSAVHVFRWVERMNRPEPDAGEFVEAGEAMSVGEFAPDDEIPDTLVQVLRQCAVDFVPETLAAAEFINEWLASRMDLASGTPLDRGVGIASFEVEGKPMHGLAQPYRFFLLARAQSEFEALESSERTGVEAILDECGLSDVMDARLTREIGREDNLEVWV